MNRICTRVIQITYVALNINGKYEAVTVNGSANIL